MRGMFFRGVVLGSGTAVLVLGASAALAGTGVGGIFNLGQSNTVNGASSLSGSTAGAQLTVSNTSTSGRGLSVNGAGPSAALLAHNSAGPAAAFQSPASVAPFSVNSTKQVTGLNASLLGGMNSTQLMGQVYSTTGFASASAAETFFTVATLKLPAGKYLLQAVGYGRIVSGGFDTTRCMISGSSHGDIDDTFSVLDPTNDNNVSGYAASTMDNLAVVTTTGETFTVQCIDHTASLSAFEAFTATKLGSIIPLTSTTHAARRRGGSLSVAP
jgi:hypothetical protein